MARDIKEACLSSHRVSGKAKIQTQGWMPQNLSFSHYALIMYFRFPFHISPSKSSIIR